MVVVVRDHFLNDFLIRGIGYFFRLLLNENEGLINLRHQAKCGFICFHISVDFEKQRAESPHRMMVLFIFTICAYHSLRRALLVKAD